MPPKKTGKAPPAKKTKKTLEPEDDESDDSFKDTQDETQEASDQEEPQAASSNTSTKAPAKRPRKTRPPKSREEMEREAKNAQIRRETQMATTESARAFMKVNMPAEFHQDKTTMPGTMNSVHGYIIESFLAWANAGFPSVKSAAAQTAASQQDLRSGNPPPASPSSADAGPAPVDPDARDFDDLPKVDFGLQKGKDKGKGKGGDRAEDVNASAPAFTENSAAPSGNDQTKRPHPPSQHTASERPEKSTKLTHQPVLPSRPFWSVDASDFKFTPTMISGSNVVTRADSNRRRKEGTAKAFQPDMQPHQERLRQMYERVQNKAADAVTRTGGQPTEETAKVLEEASDFLIDIAFRLENVVVTAEGGDGGAGKSTEGYAQGAAHDDAGARENAGDDQDDAGNDQGGAAQDPAVELDDPEDEQPRPRAGKWQRRWKKGASSKRGAGKR